MSFEPRYEPLPADSFSFEHAYLRMVLDDSPALGADSPAASADAAMPATPQTASAATPRIDLIVGDPDRIFSLASVTKPIAAYAALVAVEQGRIGLDDPAGPTGATVRHLLAHASGLPFSKGEPIAAPGRRRIYSNYGFDVLGEFLSEQLGMPVQRWVREAVAEPLGMDTFDLVAGQWLVPDADAVPGGSIAADGVASADSVARFLAELLAPTLISRELFEAAARPQFDGLAGVLPGYGKQLNNQWGLGFEIRGRKDPHWLSSDFSPRTIGHFGQSGSFIFMDPQVEQGGMSEGDGAGESAAPPSRSMAGLFLGERKYGREHAELWPELTAQLRAL